MSIKLDSIDSSLTSCNFFDIFYSIVDFLAFGGLVAIVVYDKRIGSGGQCENQVHKSKNRKHVDVFVTIDSGKVEENSRLQTTLEDLEVLYNSRAS